MEPENEDNRRVEEDGNGSLEVYTVLKLFMPMAKEARRLYKLPIRYCVVFIGEVIPPTCLYD